MSKRKDDSWLAPSWWATLMVLSIVVAVVFCCALFDRAFTSYVPVTLTSDRSGLIMDVGGKVKMRGVEIGRVGSIAGGKDPVALTLQISPDQIKYIPANVDAEISASTAFGAKYVNLIYPDDPSPQPLAAGAVLKSRNVSTEVNTVFDNLVGLLHQIDPAKLNSVLTALSDGLRGRGETIGEATTASNNVLKQLNSRSDTIQRDFHALTGFSDAYGSAAQNILSILDAASTTSTTITSHAKALDALLLNVTGLAHSGIALLGPNKDALVDAVNILEPTTNLLLKYNPEYTCLLTGSKWYLDNAGYKGSGGNGRSVLVDAAILLGNDPYVYPDNLPIVNAKGGPGGKPGCGSLPDASKNFPVRALVTDTGWGTGVDLRPNAGLGHPCYGDYFPATRAVPRPPSIRCQGLPSPGLVTPPPGPLPFAMPAPGPPPGPPASNLPPAGEPSPGPAEQPAP
jgi:phospholipid/cholesterol/gamma-HCH transport system substrate-binding protein